MQKVFTAKIDIQFMADDLEDAFALLGEHFTAVSGDMTDGDTLEFIGSVEVHPEDQSQYDA